MNEACIENKQERKKTQRKRKMTRKETPKSWISISLD